MEHRLLSFGDIFLQPLMIVWGTAVATSVYSVQLSKMGTAASAHLVWH